MEILPGIHRVLAPHQDRYLFQHIIITKEVIVFVDAGISSTPDEAIIPYMRLNKLDRGQKKYLIITHSDSDHCGGASRLKDFYPDLIIMSSVLEKPLIENADLNIIKRYHEFSEFGVSRDNSVLSSIKKNLGSKVNVDLAFYHSELLRVSNDMELKIINTSGHTLGHISIYIKSKKCLIMTDALNLDGVYSIDGKKILCPTYRYTNNYLSTIKIISNLDLEIMLGSHYEAIIGKENIEKFIEVSKNYVHVVEEYILDEVDRNEYVTLKSLIRNAGSEIAPGNRKIDSYYCLQGGLEILKQKKIIESYKEDNKIKWGYSNKLVTGDNQ